MPRVSQPNASKASSLFNGKNVIELLDEWRIRKSVGGAANILNFAHLPNALPLLKEPAEYLVSLEAPISPILKQTSQRILEEKFLIEGVTQSDPYFFPRESHFIQASRLKKIIFTNPRDAVALTDLARIYTALGQKEKAKKGILTAISLYPNHQFILRSAARFFIQADEAEQALYLINKSNRTLHDPWLLASKLSIEDILGKHHRQLSNARAIVESENFSPSELSELRGAIASIQLAYGDIKQAKKMFNKALIRPNDNVVAQAMWASQQYDVPINVRGEWFNAPFSFEAVFYQQYREGDFEQAKYSAICWFFDEPFSPRPFRAAGFVSLLLGEAELSEQYARDGLLLDKDDVELRNNLVCALTLQNKTDEALKHLQYIVHLERSLSKEIGGHTIANYGMILYRDGCFKEGEECYRQAISIFDRKNANEAKGIAISFMAREALLIGAPNAQELLTEAIAIVAKCKSRAGEKILSLVDEAYSTNKNTVTDTSTTSQWIYDRDRNILTIKKISPFVVKP